MAAISGCWVWLLLAAAAVSAARAQPCIDALGTQHGEGDFYYENPQRRCVIHRCVGGREVFQQDRCDATSRLLYSRRIAELFGDAQPPPITAADTLAALQTLQYRPIADNDTAAAAGRPSAAPISVRLSAGDRAAPLTASCTAYNGRRYYEGDAWWETTHSPCVQYVCRGGAKTVNYTVSCPPADPHCSIESVFGECCPRLTNCPPAAGAGCQSSSGAVIADGAAWWETAERPCRRLLCSSGRALLLQTVACAQLPAGCQPTYAYGECCPSCALAPSSCVDDRNQTRAEGDSWWERYDQPCRQFTCRDARKTLIETISCPAADPLCSQQLVFGQCCPRRANCKCVDRDTADGVPVLRNDGERWPSPLDPCLVRTCTNGLISQQRLSTAACQNSGSACLYGGVVRPHQSQWRVDACTTARCDNGRITTSRQQCPPLPAGCSPVHQPDQCCPVCQQTTLQSCSYGGQVRAHGSQWEIAGACLLARCWDGQLQLQPVLCPTLASHCVPAPVPGQCCPTCQTPAPTDLPCEFEGATYQHNQTWHTECGAFLCNNATVIAQYVPCPPAPGASCAPISVEGSCCVRWSCERTTYWGLCTPPTDGATHYATPPPSLCYRPGPQEGPCTETGQTLRGGCCPVFTCAQGCTDKEGSLHPHDSSWVRGCTTFHCNNGEITSVPVSCPQATNAHCRLTNPDQCCPLYDCNCGPDHPDGDQWTKGCDQFSCSDGEIMSAPVPCPDPPRYDCQAVRPPGACCAEFLCPCAAVSCPAPPPATHNCIEVGTTDDGCCRVFTCGQDCRDELGRLHQDGSEWYVECQKYSCSNGQISSAPDPCPAPPTQTGCKPIYLKSTDCCPIYDCPDTDCRPGETQFDGCRLCECASNGVFLCPQITCPERGCYHSSGLHPHGQNWTDPEKPCLTYRCAYGTVLSSVTSCPAAPGPLCVERPPPAGVCCPQWDCQSSDPCPADFTDVTWEDDCNVCTCGSAGVVCTEHLCPKQCIVNGTTFETGDSILGEHHCDRLTCLDGAAISSLDACRQPPFYGCTEVTLEGYDRECCPFWSCPHVPGFALPCTVGQIHQDEHCLFCQCVPLSGATTAVVCTKKDCVQSDCTDQEDGSHREHGSIWPTSNPCRQRACIDGVVRQLEIRCHPPPDPTCRPLRDQDRCCPIYQCSAASCEEGAVWTQDCNDCYCRNGAPLCTNRTCSSCVSGTTWTVDCNTCNCVNGQPICGTKPCQVTPDCVEGSVKFANDSCNTCTCVNSQYDCTQHDCSQLVSHCPVQSLPLVGVHARPACYNSSQCTSHFEDCCAGVCAALNNKLGSCPPPSSTHACQLSAAPTCLQDHQCPGAYKCCVLSLSCQQDGVPLRYCIDQAGDWIQN